MKKKKHIHIGMIKESDLKVRKPKAPPTQVQKSVRGYDRNKLKEETHRELSDG